MQRRLANLLFWIAFTHLELALSLTGVLSIPPSQYWTRDRDGADGLWSTFAIQIGTPAQVVRLLPGTSASACDDIWVVIPPGCSESYNADVDGCASKRGGLFLSNESTTWSIKRLENNGLFQVPAPEEDLLGLDVNADFGFDTVSLGLEGQNLPTLNQQIVAGIATNNYWLGSIGLSPQKVNFSSFDDPLPSMLGTLRNQNLIGSTSWSYTAGASYASPETYGSLTLGGFDAMRFNSSTQLSNIPFGPDVSRDLLIAISSISFNTIGSYPLLTDGIYVFIDSVVSAMYLPISVCQAFEQAFNLTWDSSTSYYILSPEQHDNLLAQNPTFTFTFRRDTNDENGPSTEIQVPYAAFDLNLTQPYVNSSTWYFPLKQAQNESEYTLGRVILQELYVIADYDRHEFSIAQAAFPPPPANLDLQAINPPTPQNANMSTPSTISETRHALSRGSIAGIVVGAVIALCLLAFITWICIRRRRKRAQANEKTGNPSPLDPGLFREGSGRHDAGAAPIPEADAVDHAIYEIGSERPAMPELGRPEEAVEIHGNAIYEASGGAIALAELGDSKKG